MRAIRIDEWGGPEVMQLVDVPEPSPADGEVLIEVSHAATGGRDDGDGWLRRVRHRAI
jgi:NADPH2:quinone reductase